MSKKIDFLPIGVFIVVFFTFFTGIIGLCSYKDEMRQKEELQKDCQHEWSVIDSFGPIKTIYCPKCKTEENVSYKTWEKMRLDEKYQTETK